jgi:hypothetical protein
MLVIKPIEEKTRQQEMVTACGGTYNEAALAYAAYDCEEDSETVRFPIGVCQFSLKAGTGVIDTLRSYPDVSDDEALMIMARACTSFLFRCGFKTAVLTHGATDPKLALRLEFLPADDGTSVLDVVSYYTGPCHGEKK